MARYQLERFFLAVVARWVLAACIAYGLLVFILSAQNWLQEDLLGAILGCALSFGVAVGVVACFAPQPRGAGPADGGHGGCAGCRGSAGDDAMGSGAGVGGRVAGLLGGDRRDGHDGLDGDQVPRVLVGVGGADTDADPSAPGLIGRRRSAQPQSRGEGPRVPGGLGHAVPGLLGHPGGHGSLGSPVPQRLGLGLQLRGSDGERDGDAGGGDPDGDCQCYFHRAADEYRALDRGPDGNVSDHRDDVDTYVDCDGYTHCIADGDPHCHGCAHGDAVTDDVHHDDGSADYLRSAAFGGVVGDDGRGSGLAHAAGRRHGAARAGAALGGADGALAPSRWVSPS